MGVQQYIGVKIVKAIPMKQEVINPKGGQVDGYEVTYEDGHISWSPKEAFEKAYRKVEDGCMSFGLALEAVKMGEAIARKGWNGKDQFVYLVDGTDLQNALKYGYGEYVGEPTITSTLAIKTSSNHIQIGWLATQSDMLAEDWYIVRKIQE